ncbi:hypothetical protein, variant [Blastomyces gilchristii SLH14081]|uniref:Uncharacterized protein n=2 Tax=Blastomyces TaxID=229219 RepID=A0A179V2G2_BLAGS|nr:uncharacterized protein BDBG_17860 [Blastomyces gilchristii SLH14081]XP_031581008.1 hypothetical protein, variant [Blastomyces gilchristii SLH14081]EGE86501.1 hypothetical protein BDDG_09446 [Blastomyces dermatitidis ATCC 18188]OAT13618.1 hypothetical protein BDBG_17860 [Blastomyces gilchristii SLH14081]OAT13619.1 hypothetical protein, variant [Blastomyces gilchristii SLH14081]
MGWEEAKVHGDWGSMQISSIGRSKQVMRVSMHINCRRIGGATHAGDVEPPIDMTLSISPHPSVNRRLQKAKACIIIITANWPAELKPLFYGCPAAPSDDT